ncbi:MAG: adenosine-specific kinase, partial [Pyrobaculum sp.]
MSLKFEIVDVPIPQGTNVIIGKAHFIKTVEDLYEALVTSVPGIKFGIAFCEASGKRL